MVQNQFYALRLFSKPLILITKSLKEDLKPLVPQLLPYKHTHAFFADKVKQTNKPSTKDTKCKSNFALLVLQ